MPARRRTHPLLVARLQAHAAQMRADPTLSELALWHELKGSQLGVGFRRQVVLPPYIVDFAARSAQLIVEVDGPYHTRLERPDAHRDAELKRRGFRVLRLSEELVLRHRGEAIRLIREALSP